MGIEAVYKTSAGAVPSRQPLVCDQSGALHVTMRSVIAGEENPGTSNARLLTQQNWNFTAVSGSTGDNTIGAGVAARLRAVRVGGTTTTTATVQIKNGATVLETILSPASVGVERDYFGGTDLDDGIRINLANATDTILVWWKAQ